MTPNKSSAQQPLADDVTEDDQTLQAGADEIPELRRGRAIPGPHRYLATNLPPLHTLPDIFADMASKALGLGLDRVLSQLGCRSLRVATMCSGTEAPLLALELIQKSLPPDQQLRISHAFSCEIVPFKQSYIERNFRPPVLFRDITELGGKKAQTAYGSWETIPGDLDILVAGTACVDFSTLNNSQKSLQQGGESGTTFNGLLQYAKKFRPRIIIQENIRNAPWDQMEKTWKELGYFPVLANLDTKHYYIPQTRERGYMVIIDQRRLKAAGLFEGLEDREGTQRVASRVSNLIAQLKRPASAPLGLFLLDDGDRRLELVEKRSWRFSRSEIRWEQYKIRHAVHRKELGLGTERPITRSIPGVNDLQTMDFYWHRFLQTEPERVWDTLDITFLKRLRQGCDINFKERFIDLSQGVDRENTSIGAAGIAGCLTPKGNPFITNRGRPISGSEALSLQGLPLDRMLLTRETQSDLMDMAGNAMTSTVVCAVMLAGLIAVHEILDGDEGASIQSGDAEAPLLVPNEIYSLVRSTLQSAEVNLVDHSALEAKAARSVVYCLCERQTEVRDSIFRCTLCGHTACRSCHGNPTHAYQNFPLSRENPTDFIANMKKLVPMKLMLSGLSESIFETFKPLYSTDILSQFWDDFIQCVRSAVSDVSRFFEIKRGRKWRVVYDGDHSSLFLEVGPDSIQWLLYAKPPKSASMRSPIREVLAKPIARMTPSLGSLVDGNWEVSSPMSTPFSLTITGQGNQVPSFQATCGLQDDNLAESKVWDTLFIEAPKEAVAALDVDISGLYNWLPECGTALGSLYRKETTPDTPPVFLFLDPTKVGPLKEDACVFAFEHSRLPGYDVRMTIAELTPTWSWVSLNLTLDSQRVSASCRQWAKAPKVQFAFFTSEHITLDTLQPGTQVSIGNQDCHNTTMTIACLSACTATINLPDATHHWQSWDPEASARELKSLAWLFPKISGWSDFENWNEIIRTNSSSQSNDCHENCDICDPPRPTILWGRNNVNEVVPYENPQEAAIYERAIKSRPSPFLVFRRINEHGDAELRFTLNVQTLSHKAEAKLVGAVRREAVSLHWRLLPHAYDMHHRKPGRFTLGDNTSDACASQPPNFRSDLRREQLRSLTWMVSQEATDIEPFVEEEVEESILPSMPWRAEVKATIPKVVRGGVLADEVGYGKTAIVLALIDAQFANDCSRPIEEDHGLIPTKATLIVVPSSVYKQWISEIKKFLGNKYNVLGISSNVNRVTIKDVQDADIVVLSWTALARDSYYARLQKFTGAPQVPTATATGRCRIFDSWFQDASASLRESVQTLRTSGPDVMLQQVEARRRKLQESQADCTYVPSRRRCGKALAAAGLGSGTDDSESGPDSGFDDSDDSDSNQVSSTVGQPKRGRMKEGPGAKRRKTTSSTPHNKIQTERKVVANYRKEFNITEGDSQDWRTVKVCLHAFRFNRLVIDEYTYAVERRLTSLLSLQARSKWILSGTPGLDEFADIKSIALYLGLNLGIDDDGDCDSPANNTSNVRRRRNRKNHTDMEAFQYYQAPHSNAWYQNRRELAQRFLDRFVRQNIAEIKHIELIQTLVMIDPSPAEERNYNRLFEALKEETKDVSGPVKSILLRRMSPKYALVLCGVTAHAGKRYWTPDQSQEVVKKAASQAIQIAATLDSLIREAITFWHREPADPTGNPATPGLETSPSPASYRDSLVAKVKEKYGTNFSEDFINRLKLSFDSYGDWGDVKEIEAKVDKRYRNAVSVVKGRRGMIKMGAGIDNVPTVAASGVRKTMWTEILCQLKILAKVSREKRFNKHLLRIFEGECPQCEHEACATSEVDENVNLLEECGHALCGHCLQTAKMTQCCPVEGCKVKFVAAKVVCREDVINEGATQSSKLCKLIQIINGVPHDELVIVFIQDPALVLVTSGVLEAAGIEHRKVTKSSMTGIAEFIMEPRQKKGSSKIPSRPKALLLELGSSMAAGLNLQCANHIIFLSPLIASTQYEYDSGMTQAIGRARRYGQERTVYVYHLLMKNMYDVNVYQSAHGGLLVERDGVPTMVAEREIRPGDIKYEGEELPAESRD
ncbi:C-5 cytosine methyltransferase [Penicillium sp. DV-2018c]|nr:C-5 cytosine methyltransferase [Penicillium sp. DV-2018c]